MKQVLSINGRKLTFSGDPNDPYFQRLDDFHNGNRELAAEVLRLPQDAVSLDVGANIGLTALTIATAAPRGHVFAFEPSPRNVKFLRENVRANEAQNVTVVEAAVGISDGGTVLIETPVCGANAVVVRSVRQPPAQAAAAQLVSLDAWAARAGVDHVDFIKLDVEGYEADVLYGAASLLAAHRPAILMEFNSITIIMEARANPLVFAEALASTFHIYRYGESGILNPLPNETDELRQFVFDNCTQRGFIDDILLRLRPDTSAEMLRQSMAPFVSVQQG